MLKEMKDTDVVVFDAHAEPKTTRPTEASLVPAAVLPRLQDYLPQTRPQEELYHMKARYKGNAPPVLGRQCTPRASPMGCRRNTACPQTGRVMCRWLTVQQLPFQTYEKVCKLEYVLFVRF
jgi:hypothetical protein